MTTVSAPIPAPAMTSGRHLITNGIRLHFLDLESSRPEHGSDPDGQTVVLIPGIVNPAITWEFVGRHLAAFGRVIVLDNRGRGLSSGGPDIGYTLDDYAQDAAGFTVIFTLDTDSPPAPPTGILADSVTIGSIAGTSIAHPTQYTVTAVFDIPAAEATGLKDVSVTFAVPGDTLEYSMTDGFTITEAVDTPPSIAQHPRSRTVVSDSTVTLTVLASGTAPLEYQWKKPSS